jgi:DNA-binding CsgD family transcriptional regulator
MTSEVKIRFLRFRGRRVAIAVNGVGSPVVAPAWWVSHLELDWRDDAFRSFWSSVGAGHMLVRYDHPGVGISDREMRDADLTLEAEVALLYGAYLDGRSIVTPEARQAILGAVRSHWGVGARVLADIFLGEAGAAERERFARLQREAASAETAAALLELVYRLDVRAAAEGVRAPTLVVHRRADRAIPYEQGRELAAAIPRASLTPLEGSAHLPWVGDAESVVRAWRPFLTPDHQPADDVGDSAEVQLSRREREVLALVANGLSEREIAEQLVLSEHTVHRHVANIRSKLGRGSRTAAVAEAARLGLI